MDFSSLFSSEATPEEEMRARIAALRGQKDLGTLAMLSGDKVLQPFGQAQITDAQHGEQVAEQGQDRRLTRALAAQKDAEQRDYQKQQIGLEGDRLKLARDQAGKDKFRELPTNTGLVRWNPQTNETQPIPGAGGSQLQPPKGALNETRQNALLERMATRMEHELNPSTWGGSGKIQVVTRDQADHVLGLAKKANGDINNLDVREQLELAEGFARLVKGGQATEHEAMALLPPKTLQSGVAGIQEWLRNEPHGRDQQAFTERMTHSIERQKGIAEQKIRQQQAQSLGSHGKFRQLDPDNYEQVLRSAGLDPANIDDKGIYQLRSPEDEKALRWARAHKDSPDAAGILKKLGVSQ